jgi:tRNA threonylcarbamoyladenosine modification (KEOPS) complex Cgi121 subunit
VQREGSFSCLCWEISTKPEEIDALLARTRGGSPGAVIQIFRASRAPNPSAVLMIAAQTLTAAKSGATLAEKPELDLLLRLAGTRQIGEAFRRVGYRSSGKRMFMVAAAEGKGQRLKRLGDEMAKAKGFKEVKKRALAKADLEKVEVAALLSVRL